MRRKIIQVTLALSMLVTALHLAPQPVRAEEAEPFDLAKAIRDAKTPAEHEAIASYYDQAATAAYAKAAEYRNLALNQQHLAVTGRSQFLSDGHYRQLEQFYNTHQVKLPENYTNMTLSEHNALLINGEAAPHTLSKGMHVLACLHDDRWRRWVPIPMRMILGVGFVVHGWAKWSRGPAAFAALLKQVDVPWPLANAWLVTLLETLNFSRFVARKYSIVS